MRISLEASLEACFAEAGSTGGGAGLALGRTLMASWGTMSGEENWEKEPAHLFAGHVMDSELDLAHAACAESLADGVVAEDAV